jgi:hypothetical protein
MSCIQFESIVFGHLLHVHAAGSLALSLHHLHHDTHRARHLASDKSRGVCESLRDGNFANRVTEFVLEPEAEGSDLVLRDTVERQNLFFEALAKILLDLLIGRLNGDKFLSFVISQLLEQNFVDVVS